MAPGTAKVGRHDFCDRHWRTENYHQRTGSAFYFFALLPFYLYIPLEEIRSYHWYWGGYLLKIGGDFLTLNNYQNVIYC